MRIAHVLAGVGLAGGVYAQIQVPLNTADASAHGRTTREIINPQLYSAIQDIVKAQNLSGLSVGLVRPGGKTELKTWGIKTDERDAMTSDTLFNLASCSKAFAAASIGILMDDYALGKNSTPLPPGLKEFNWNTKVKDILPGEWQIMDSWASEKANIRDILSHVSGLPRHDYSYGPYDSPKDTVLRMKHLRPAYELREHWHYNNQMYVTASYIISKYAGSYMTFVKERIFKPLNMTSTTFSPKEAIASGKVTATWTHKGRRIPFWFTEDVIELQAGAGGVTSSAEDMVKWLGLLLNKGVHPKTNETIISFSAFNEITTAHIVTDGKAPNPNLSVAGYGMGWWRQSYRGHEFVYHSGAIPGFSTRTVFLPSDGLGMVILLNVDEKASVHTELSFKLMDSFFSISEVDPYSYLNSDAQVNSDEPTASSPPYESSTEQSTDLSSLSGTYSNPGYGAFTVCDPSSTSLYCSEVLADFAAVDSVIGGVSGAYLYAAWPRIWSTHLRFIHRRDNEFELIFTALFPKGYGPDLTPFETTETGEGQGRAEFVVENGKVIGFGLFGLIGEETERDRLGGSVQQRAEAWFTRVM
ncbi:beta-lactamase/transpeptidase-like protein [Neolentinus lepideus HHB14362 ss-1]|uniref:Beta-lactamase/transpeptidase-like protein n=1 Tax=Neolentinus lepideus HHB14362 ss-1 TaxID=1314782 RepID=A0A165RHX8_9AGAM|nr:beta-lactamase/transpeptidase-like protein [Neolentinus lepideus HHB14362 ss-1]